LRGALTSEAWRQVPASPTCAALIRIGFAVK
jgi:hypothetical protein